MAVQLSYALNPAAAVEGMLADSGRPEIVSGLCGTRKLVSVAIGADNDDLYTITINGVDFDYQADGSATTAEIAAGLVAAINAGSEPVVASGADTPILIESTLDGPDGDFTYADATSGAGTLTETVLVEQGQEVGFGKYVCLDERVSEDLDAEDFPVRLPRQSSDITGGLRLGVVLEDKAREANDGAFRANTMLPVCREGRVWVRVEEAVAKGNQVHVRYAAGGDGLGSFGDTTGSSERAALPGCFYLTSAASGELAVASFAK